MAGTCSEDILLSVGLVCGWWAECVCDVCVCVCVYVCVCGLGVCV